MFTLHKVLTRTALSLVLIVPTLALAAENQPSPPVKATAETSLDGLVLHGKVLETMNSSGYTYLQLDATQGKIWVAIPETQIKTGQTVTCTPGMTMYNFTSKTLNRTFEWEYIGPSGAAIGSEYRAVSSCPGNIYTALNGKVYYLQGKSVTLIADLTDQTTGTIPKIALAAISDVRVDL